MNLISTGNVLIVYLIFSNQESHINYACNYVKHLPYTMLNVFQTNKKITNN